MKKLITFLFSLTLLFSIFSSPISAEKTTQTLIIPKEEVIDSDLLKAAESLIVSGKINGDVYLLGGTVTFDGEVAGDLFAAGGVVKISGKIGHDIRAVGGQVIIDAQVGQNIAVAGGTVDLSKETLIPGSLLVAAGNLETKAPVTLGAKMALGRGVINAPIGKDVKILADEELIFGPDTKIGGNLTYRASAEAQLQKGATISGETKFIPQAATDKELKLSLLQRQKIQKELNKVLIPFKLFNLFVTFIIGFILLKIFPHFFVKTANLLKGKLASSLGWGLLILALSPTIIGLLVLTLIGIPVALFIILIFALALFLGKLIGSFCLGRWILKKLTQDERRGWALLVGLLVYSLLKTIPYLGWLFVIGLVTATLGSMALSIKGLSSSKKQPSSQK
jgi:hypothetical protein